MTLTITDFFCGAGGSSAGATQVPGLEVTAAANHWDLAVKTHAANHPNADHICADLSQYEPAAFPHSDLAWFSPSCTSHTVAQGKARADRAAAWTLGEKELPLDAFERSRATMWDVVRFTEHHQYTAIVVENVVEVMNWAPFPAWLMAMEALGYQWRILMLNSMHAGLHGPAAAQSRDRFYAVFWRDINPPDLDAVVSPQGLQQVFKKPGVHRGKYRTQYVYVDPFTGLTVEPATQPASTVIDWANPGTPIGKRRRPLAPKTMAKIRAGITRHWGEHFTAPGTHHGLVMSYYGQGGMHPTSRPMPTITTVEKQALLTGSTTNLNDIHFRMLTDTELAAAMAFPTDYRFEGTKRERVRMIGNAVTTNAARDILTQITNAT